MEDCIFSKLSSCYGLLALLTIFPISDMKMCSAARFDLHRNTNIEFIKRSCEATMYPQLCFQSLSMYASTVQRNPRRLAQAALNVTLTSARLTSDMVVKLSKVKDVKPRVTAAIMDCVETVGDSVDELQQSLVQMRHLRGQDIDFQMSNIQTWVSAALTNEDTCMDGFEGNAMNGNIKDKVRRAIVSVAQLTSNALALINSLSTQANIP